MPDDVSPERIATLAAGARISLGSDGAARIARTVTPTLARFTAGPIEMPLETEPSTFVALQHKDARR